MERRYFVYILSSRSRSLYIGVTNNLYRRAAQHRLKASQPFTARYNIHRLVYVECFDSIRIAIAREKQIKAWRREKKPSLIEKASPTWEDLSEEWFAKFARTGSSPCAREHLLKETTVGP